MKSIVRLSFVAVDARACAVFLIAVLLSFLAGCRGSRSSAGLDSRSNAASSAASLNSSLAIALDVQYPADVPVTAEIQGAIDNAQHQSDDFDAHCAQLPMSENLTPRRPGGIGCPREEVQDTSESESEQ